MSGHSKEHLWRRSHVWNTLGQTLVFHTKVVTLSSGEAELYGVVKGATEALGLRSLAQDLGIGTLEIHLHADSSAAIGICNRSGIGKL